jgi:ATP-dependent RNA helicase DeaD
MEFKKLGIPEYIQKNLEFDAPTNIQKRTIPLVLAGKDVIAGSETGSGKTLAFGVGVLRAEKGKGIQSLVLTPTRELAEQIAKELDKFSANTLNIITVYGGVSIENQIMKLRTADIVVATPGRVLDHLQRGTMNLGRVKILVLDEADRMLDMGFIEDVEKIIKQCPAKRQTLLFSATIPDELARLAHRYMRHPARVYAGRQVDPKKLKQVYYDVDEGIKLSLLVHLLKKDKGIAMVFCNSRHTVDFVAGNLQKAGVNAEPIHGGYTQDKRNKQLEAFHAKKSHVLVCTDVAARGLDIKDVSHVYNYDIPKEAKQYIHRIGRTARAGKNGKAVNLLSKKDHDNFSRIIRDYGVNVKKEEKPYVERVAVGSSTRFSGRCTPPRYTLNRGHSCNRRHSSHRRRY